MKNYVTEFIGTFFLALTVCLTVANGTEFAPLAIGCSLMIMVYMGGHVSGGHYNPAVTLGVTMRGRLPVKDAVPYMLFQVAGAFAASAVVKYVLDRTIPVAPAGTASSLHALIIEFLFTFALVMVVLNSATAKATTGNSFYGLAIGFTVVVGAFAGGPISGGAFNPAIGIGPNLMHTISGGGSLNHVWLYLVGPFAGGIVAALVFKMQNPGDK